MALTELIAEYKQRVSEMGNLQKAKAEKAIVEAAKQERKYPAGLRMREWFCKHLGDNDDRAGYEYRYHLLNRGDELLAFWAYVDEAKLSTSSISTMVIAARRLQTLVGKNKLTLGDALEKVMLAREYPTEAPLPDAVKNPKRIRPYVRRKKAPVPTAPTDPPPPSIPTPPPPADEPSVVEGEVSSSKAFWRGIREYSSKFVAARTAGLKETEKQEVLRKFETDIKIVVDELVGRINRMKQHAKVQSITSMNIKLRMACDRIGVPPPRDGKFNFARAKKQYKALSFSLHPDQNNDPSVEQQYRDVQEAWQIITGWWENTGKGKGS